MSGKDLTDEYDDFELIEGSFVKEDTLGQPTFQHGRFTWNPPSGLDPAVVDAVQQSVEALNLSIEKGDNKVNPDGKVE